jgi:hypothetical protein
MLLHQALDLRIMQASTTSNAIKLFAVYRK